MSGEGGKGRESGSLVDAARVYVYERASAPGDQSGLFRGEGKEGRCVFADGSAQVAGHLLRRGSHEGTATPHLHKARAPL